MPADRSFDRVLILGAGGQLGSALLRQRWPFGTFVLPATRDQLDLHDPLAVWSYLLRWRPQLVINAAGFTDVDRAERHPEEAFALNHHAVTSIVQGVRAIGSRLIHISTDYVFDGAGPGWYREADPVNPLGVYGQSKQAGELAALELDDSLVVRTSCLFSATGQNFVTAIRDRGRGDGQFELVDDHRFCPTSADEVAAALVAAIGSGLDQTGVFHLASPDSATWWELADEVLRLDGRRDRARLGRISSEQRLADGSWLARRPADSTLSSDAFATAYDITLSPWREALALVWKELERLQPDRPPAGVHQH